MTLLADLQSLLGPAHVLTVLDDGIALPDVHKCALVVRWDVIEQLDGGCHLLQPDFDLRCDLLCVGHGSNYSRDAASLPEHLIENYRRLTKF